MNSKILSGASAAAVIIVLALWISGSPDVHYVARVIDGDTLVLDNGERVRLLGMDTPERGEPYYKEARDRLILLVINKSVTLERGKENRDRYGRLLRWVRVGDVLADLDLVERGFARTFMLYEGDRYYNELMEAERNARAAGTGIWSIPQDS